MLFLRAIRQLIDPIDPKQQRPEFEIEIFKESGELVKGRCVCTSTNWDRNTINLKFVESGEIRKLHAALMVRFNGKEVML